MLLEPPVNVKLKLVGSPDRLVTLETWIRPGTATVIPGRVWALHLDGDPGRACKGPVHVPLLFFQVRIEFTVRLPAPVLSMQLTWMFCTLAYRGLCVGSLAMSPHTFPSRLSHGGSGAVGKSLTEHVPVKALPPSCATQTPMS
jgi:hypothetical protein